MFAEEMRNLGAELHIVLPFDQSDFRSTSVNFKNRIYARWNAKFDAVLKAVPAKRIHYATSEPYV